MLLLQTNPINDVEWIFPALECMHIIGFGLSIGTITILDLRLLGVGMQRQTPRELLKTTAPWTLAGLAVMLFSGPMLFLSDPPMYLRNPSFRFKITMLAIAILYNYTVHRMVAKSDSAGSSGPQKVAAILSIALWVSVVAGGLFIAFV